MQWFLDNLLAEFIFGVLGVTIVASRKYLLDHWRSRQLLKKVLLVHNSPTRTRQRGLCLADRFMQLYESKLPLRSTGEFVIPYAIWHNVVVDKKLEGCGLVQIFEQKGNLQARAVRNRLSKIIYGRLKRNEDKERQKTDDFLQNP